MSERSTTLSGLLALESTVIAHGLPYPDNLHTARELEAIARAHGVEPRTIAVVGGEIKVGLNDAELQRLADPSSHSGPGVMKLARRDIAVALAAKRDGATTVSATMFLAHRAGIRVFATGGIGGVHRPVSSEQTTVNSEQSTVNSQQTTVNSQPLFTVSRLLFTDISADLQELASTPVAVVCAGAKAILDLPATLEYLETHGVPVLVYETDEFPAFYSRSSGLRMQARVESVEEAAKIIRTHWRLGNSSGVLVCVPIPQEDEIPREVIEPFIEQALREAGEQKITGSAVTPFLLRRLAELTQGDSVRANVALLKNNVAVAAEIAKALALLDIPVV
ncbi:MAG: pseudouridine-5'-phosphate glycosidase [Chloroflexi bacterium]|nr:pseudouridine-5'-phosphate glycosidase [Chloroflexota bacterium]